MEWEPSFLLFTVVNMTESTWSSIDEKPFHCVHEELVKKNNQPMGDDDPSGLRGFIQNPYLFGIALFSSLGGLLFGCKSLKRHKDNGAVLQSDNSVQMIKVSYQVFKIWR